MERAARQRVDLRRDRHRLRSMPDCIEQRRHVGRRGQMQRWNTLLERRQCCNRASRQQLGHKRRDVLLLDQPAGREAQHAAEHRLTIDVCSVERLGGARQLRQPLVQQVMPAVPRCVQQRAVAARVTLVVVERHAKAVTLCDHPRRQLAAARGEHIQEGRRARCVCGVDAGALLQQEGRDLELAALKRNVQWCAPGSVARRQRVRVAHKLAHALGVVDGRGKVERRVASLRGVSLILCCARVDLRRRHAAQQQAHLLPVAGLCGAAQVAAVILQLLLGLRVLWRTIRVELNNLVLAAGASHFDTAVTACFVARSAPEGGLCHTVCKTVCKWTSIAGHGYLVDHV
mmetsp:Transcript_40323/g.120254  ORF Transcript_40323/g.120254 Transcript_40323/m.120254 type:complete len:344 (-) Transcript_40323:36-1067(-)